MTYPIGILTVDKTTSSHTWRYSYNGVQFEKLQAPKDANDCYQECVKITMELGEQFGLTFKESFEVWENRVDE